MFMDAPPATPQHSPSLISVGIGGQHWEHHLLICFAWPQIPHLQMETFPKSFKQMSHHSQCKFPKQSFSTPSSPPISYGLCTIKVIPCIQRFLFSTPPVLGFNPHVSRFQPPWVIRFQPPYLHTWNWASHNDVGILLPDSDDS